MKTYLIGAGGVGSWLAASLVRLIKPENLVVVDGDALEEKNLDRQLFTRDHIGRNKADALAELYGCDAIPDWYGGTTVEHDRRDIIIGVVDNHPARASILSACDYYGCMAIIAANEVHSAEAYVYLPDWKGTNLDPREYYPEITQVTEGDPRAAAIGCTGEAQKANRQLVSANFNAAALAQSLFVCWAMEARRMEPETIPHLPHRLSLTLTGAAAFKSGQPKRIERTTNGN